MGGKDHCFCTLALGKRYRDMALEIAGSLEEYCREVKLVVLTDRPGDFAGSDNVRAFKHRQTGVLHPYQDKRFVLMRGLEAADTAIFIDADTRIIRPPSLRDVRFEPGITAVSENLAEHIEKTVPSRLPVVGRLCGKLALDVRKCRWIGEALVVVKKDSGKEKSFLDMWDRAGRYLELRGIVSGVGIQMGIAAAAAGLRVHSGDRYGKLSSCMEHFDASGQRPGDNPADFWIKRIGYHYRLNRERLKALKDPGFYYGKATRNN